MHLVIGMLASTLLARSKFGRKDGALSFWGVLELRHEIPGRLRLHCPAVRDDAAAADTVVRELPRLPGVAEVRADHRTGSIIVRYEPHRLDVQTIQLAILKLLGLEEAAENPAPSALTKETEEIFGSLNKALLEVSRGAVDVDFLVPTVLMGLATYRMISKTRTGLPEAFTLFWWAFTWLTRRSRSGSV